MLFTKVKIATAVLLMAAVVDSGARGIGLMTATAKPPEVKQPDRETTSHGPKGAVTVKIKVEAKQTVLTPEEAVKQRPKGNVTVEFKAKQIGFMANPAFVPEGGEVDDIFFKCDGEFYVYLNGKAVTHIKRLGIEPSVFFRDKVLRVTGSVVFGEAPAGKRITSVAVEDLDHIQVLDCDLFR